MATLFLALDSVYSLHNILLILNQRQNCLQLLFPHLGNISFRNVHICSFIFLKLNRESLKKLTNYKIAPPPLGATEYQRH